MNSKSLLLAAAIPLRTPSAALPQPESPGSVVRAGKKIQVEQSRLAIELTGAPGYLSLNQVKLKQGDG